MEPPAKSPEAPQQLYPFDPDLSAVIRSVVGIGEISDAIHRSFMNNRVTNLEQASLACDFLKEMVAALASEPPLPQWKLTEAAIGKILQGAPAKLEKRRMEEEERSKKKAKREQSSGQAAVKAHPAPENSREWVRHRAGLTLDRVNPRHSKAYELRAHLRDIAENMATRSIHEEENGAIKIKCFVCPIMMSVTNWSNYEQHLRSQHKDKDKDNKEVPLLIEKKRPVSPVAQESSSSQSTTLSGESEAPLGQLLSDMATTLNDLSDSQVSALSPSSVLLPLPSQLPPN